MTLYEFLRELYLVPSTWPLFWRRFFAILFPISAPLLFIIQALVTIAFFSLFSVYVFFDIIRTNFWDEQVSDKPLILPITVMGRKITEIAIPWNSTADYIKAVVNDLIRSNEQIQFAINGRAILDINISLKTINIIVNTEGRPDDEDQQE